MATRRISDALTDPSARLGHTLWQAHMRTRELLEGAIQPWDLTLSSFDLLGQITRQPGVTAADLARSTGMTPQAVSKVLSRLEEAGLVRRRALARGARAQELHLTRHGLSVVDACVYALSDAEGKLSRRMGRSRSRELQAGLEHLVKVIDASDHEDRPPT